jgi:hypothetical protein
MSYLWVTHADKLNIINLREKPMETPPIIEKRGL